VPANPYDEIAYATFPRLVTHPDRMAAVGTFFGMCPAPVTGCRVLEIACGNGNNLIPMAYGLPGSDFTGMDLAEQPIAAGQRVIRDLGLGNIRLMAADLMEFGEDAGEFDYIIAHGLYSWVPQPVRERLMAVCRRLLAERGIAFISFNAYPGRHVRMMLREMMLSHTRDIQDPLTRVREARSFLELLQRSKVLSQAWAEVIEAEIRTVLSHGEGGLAHDDLGEVNDAFWFRDFAAHAHRHRLQYLGESDFTEMFDHNSALPWLANDVIEREQYLDFLKFRRFRQTMLCREEVKLDRDPPRAVMERFLFSSPARKLESGQIEGLRGIRISSSHTAVGGVAEALGETYPLPLCFEELVPYAGNRGTLAEVMHSLVTGGFADMHTFDFPCEDTVTEKPKASRLVRYQAAESRYVTSAAHHIIELDEVGRLLMPLLDGTRTIADIARALARLAGAPAPGDIEKHLPASLEWFARQGLLEG
jgi:methyltransferase-like protein/cyclopropane fatty-acyl-phospholipid synthase-like methyltransferase